MLVLRWCSFLPSSSGPVLSVHSTIMKSLREPNWTKETTKELSIPDGYEERNRKLELGNWNRKIGTNEIERREMNMSNRETVRTEKKDRDSLAEKNMV